MVTKIKNKYEHGAKIKSLKCILTFWQVIQHLEFDLTIKTSLHKISLKPS